MPSLYSSVCKAVSNLTKSESDESTSRNYLVQKMINKKFPINSNTQKLFQNISNVVNKHPKSQIMDEKTLNSIINKEISKYNKSNKQKINPTKYRMIYKIHAMLGSNELLLQSFLDQYNDSVLNSRGIKLTKKDIEDGIHIVPLDKISTNMVQSLYWEVHQTYNSTQEKDFEGVIGNLRMMWSRPTRMAKFDPTGGLMKVAKAARGYLGKVTAQVSNFMGNEVKNGMNNVFNRLETETLNKILNKNQKARLVNFFIMNMQGWIKIEHSYIDSNDNKVIVPKEDLIKMTVKQRDAFIKKNNVKTETLINADYGIIKDKTKDYDKKFYRFDKEKNQWIYRSTGDPVYDYFNLVPIKDYISGKTLLNKKAKSDLKNNISLRNDVRFVLQVKEMMSDLSIDQMESINIQKEMVEARKIHKEVFDDVKLRFKDLDTRFKQEIYKWFPGARNDKTFREKILKATLEGDFSKLNKDDRNAAQYLYETFGKQVLVDPFMTGETTILEKKDSFPIEYEKNHMFAMYEGLLPEIEQAIENTKDLLKAESNPKIKKKLIIKKFELESQRRKVLQNQAMFNDQEVDTYSEKNMYTKRDAKSFRHISNTFDIRNMKLTKDIYSNYLRRMYTTLERGNLSVETMGGSRVTGSNKLGRFDENINPVMVDYGINLMKTVLHKPDAKSNVFGYDFSTSKMHKHFFGKFKKLGISQYKLDKYNRMLSAYITGRYLGRVSTAILNRTVIINKIINYGLDSWKESRTIIKNHKNIVNSFVAETGITDWSDYFTDELLGDLTQTDVVSRDESIKIVQLMLNYHIQVKKGVSEAKAKKN